MLLSVIVYRHKLTVGQYLGAMTVFGGISIEAWIKRRGMRLCVQVIYLIMLYFHNTRYTSQEDITREGKGEIKILITGISFDPCVEIHGSA